jgi:hypothetical protein
LGARSVLSVILSSLPSVSELPELISEAIKLFYQQRMRRKKKKKKKKKPVHRNQSNTK